MNISSQARQLIREQREEWELAKKNYAGLQSAQTRKLAFDGFDLKVQYNPQRIISSAAKVDPKSIKARPCFLCQKNLPNEQKGIPVSDKYMLLVNPFPIFPEHLTIPHVDHMDQRIENAFEDMLDLAGHLEDFTVFYNGPKCGASAPDHLHFQAGNKSFMPIERDYRDGTFFQTGYTKNGIDIIPWTAYLRSIVTFCGREKVEIVSLFQELYQELKKVQPNEKEPMLNILASWDSGRLLVHIFPRKLHRPRQYFEEGTKQIVFSPASVDMGGVLITPREEDFNKLTTDDIKDIFGQVCMEEATFEKVLKALIK